MKRFSLLSLILSFIAHPAFSGDRVETEYLPMAKKDQNWVSLTGSYGLQSASTSVSVFPAGSLVPSSTTNSDFELSRLFVSPSYERGLMDWLSARIGFTYYNLEQSVDSEVVNSQGEVTNDIAKVTSDQSGLASIDAQLKLAQKKEWLDLVFWISASYWPADRDERLASFHPDALDSFTFEPLFAGIKNFGFLSMGMRAAYLLRTGREATFDEPLQKLKVRVSGGSRWKFGLFFEEMNSGFHPGLSVDWVKRNAIAVETSTDNGATYSSETLYEQPDLLDLSAHFRIPIFSDVYLIPRGTYSVRLGENFLLDNVESYSRWQAGATLRYFF